MSEVGESSSVVDQMDLLLNPEKEIQWIETFLSVPSEDEGIIPWRVTPQQRRISEVTQRIRRLLIIKGRQTRCSTLLLAKAVRDSGISYGKNYVICTQTNEMTQNFRIFIKDRLNDLRNALNDPEAYSTDSKYGGADNDDILRFGKRQNTFHFASAEQKAGLRGIQTAHWIHCSEVAHWSEASAKRIIGGLDPACPANGFFVLESTPNGAAGLFYNRIQDSRPLVEVSRWTTQFFPWWIEPKYTADYEGFRRSLSDIGLDLDNMKFTFQPSPAEEALMSRENLTVGHMLWRRFKTQELLATGQFFAQEYPEDLLSCWLAAGIGFFMDDQFDHLSYYRDGIREPRQKLRDRDYQDPVTGLISTIDFLGPNLHIWEPPLPGHKYVAFQDVSAGVSQDGDYSALEILDTENLRQVAELRVRTLPTRVGKMAAAVAAWYNWAFLGVERNTYGVSALEALNELHYPNLYYDVVNQPEHPELGWYTATTSRELMLNRFRAKVFNHQVQLSSRMAVMEMGGFTWKQVQGRTGNVQFRAEASSGGNDDVVIALAGATTIAPYAPNRIRLGSGFVTADGDDREGLVVVDGKGTVVRPSRSRVGGYDGPAIFPGGSGTLPWLGV